MLILISGCSGAGKNTVIQGLIQKNQNLRFLQSCTTRKHRPNEKYDTYEYLTKTQFDNLIKNDEMFEYEEIHQNFYGLTKKALQNIVEHDKIGVHYIKDIGVLGQINLSRALKNKVPVLSIFLSVPRAELIRRLQVRGEKDIDLRLSRMEFECGYLENFDEIVKNVDLAKTIVRVEKLIAKYKRQYKKEKEKL